MGQPSRREIYPGHLVVASCSMRGSWGKTEVVREACGAGDVYLTFIFLLCNPLNVLLRPWGKPAACVDQKEQKRETIRNNQDGFREQRHTPRESQESERGNRCTDGLSDMAYSGKGDLWGLENTGYPGYMKHCSPGEGRDQELSHKRMSVRHYPFNISFLVTCFRCGFIPGVFQQPNVPPAVLLSASPLVYIFIVCGFFWCLFNYKSNLCSSVKSKWGKSILENILSDVMLKSRLMALARSLWQGVPCCRGVPSALLPGSLARLRNVVLETRTLRTLNSRGHSN